MYMYVSLLMRVVAVCMPAVAAYDASVCIACVLALMEARYSVWGIGVGLIPTGPATVGLTWRIVGFTGST